jgi:hypothetical protein
MATEADDYDDYIGDIIKANENCEKIFKYYQTTFENELSTKLEPIDSKLKSPFGMSIDDDCRLINLTPNNQMQSDNIFLNEYSSESIATSIKPDKNIQIYDPLKELNELLHSNQDIKQNNSTESKPNYLQELDSLSFLTTQSGKESNQNAVLRVLKGSNEISNLQIRPTTLSNSESKKSFILIKQ